MLSHANNISLLIYILLYTALNKKNGVTKVNCGRMSIRELYYYRSLSVLFHSSRAITDLAYNFNVKGEIPCRISYG